MYLLVLPCPPPRGRELLTLMLTDQGPRPHSTGSVPLQKWVATQRGRRKRHSNGPRAAPHDHSLSGNHSMNPPPSARRPLSAQQPRCPDFHTIQHGQFVSPHLPVLIHQLWLPGELNQERLEGVGGGGGFLGEGSEAVREPGGRPILFPACPFILVEVWLTCTVLSTQKAKLKTP